MSRAKGGGGPDSDQRMCSSEKNVGNGRRYQIHHGAKREEGCQDTADVVVDVGDCAQSAAEQRERQRGIYFNQMGSKVVISGGKTTSFSKSRRRCNNGRYKMLQAVMTHTLPP